MTFYEELLQALEDRHIRYLVVGGVAVVLHGFIRATADLDLMIGLEAKNVDAFLTLMKERGYKPKVPVALEDFKAADNRRRWKDDKGMLVISLFHPQRNQELIDVFIDEPIPFEEAYQRRTLIPLGRIKISVANSADLIKLKEQARRPQDLEDIQALKNLERNR